MLGRIVGSVAGLMVVAGALGAQTQPEVPQVVVTARGEVQVTPDRARIQLGVQTEAATAAQAAAENAKKQTAVLAAIRKLGVAERSITTVNYSVYPVQRWNEQQRVSEVIGYRVSNIVQVDAERLDQTAAIIDAALASGANRVAGLEFRLSDQAKWRDSALTVAVRNARRQAEVAARAAGGAASSLLELTVQEFGFPEPRPMVAMAMAREQDMAQPTPVSEGTMTVTVVVTTRWRFQ